MAVQDGHSGMNGNGFNGSGGYYLGTRYTNGYQQSGNNGELIDFKKFLSLFISHKWLILLFVLVGAGLAIYICEEMTPVYESTGTMYITDTPDNATWWKWEFADYTNACE